MIVPVILSGGSGTRLWPLSTPERPKQFLALSGETSLFAQTLARVGSQYGPPIVVANTAHEELCRDELRDHPESQLILEPVARNTAVAIAMAAGVAVQCHGDVLLLVMPSDHLIGSPSIFHEAVRVGEAGAQNGLLITFGIKPSSPETGYGYLEAGEELPGLPGLQRVARFTEKPDRATAEAMVAGGQHYWNGGIFLFNASAFLREIEQHAPDIAICARKALSEAGEDGKVIRPAISALEGCPSISVDYAVMERSESVAMVSLDARWSDVGSWDALADLATAEGHDPQAVSLQSRNCFVRSSGPRISLLGVDDLIVVANGDDVVVMRRGLSQQIKQLAAEASKD